MKVSVRVEVEVPSTLVDELAQVAARALEERGAVVLHAAAVKRRR